MDFGDSKATRATERIMALIREHLKTELPPNENHHFNRVYEKVHRVLAETWNG